MAAIMPGNGPRHSNGPAIRPGGGFAPAIVWLVALLVLLTLPFFLYYAFAANIERMDARISRAASEQLESFAYRSDTGRDLAAKAADLLNRDELGLNYLTLRDADGNILLSGGRFETLGESLSADRARRLRGWLYRLVSADRGVSLRRDGRQTGHVAYGVDLRHGAATMSVWFWLGFFLWLLALIFTLVLLGSVRTLLGREPYRTSSTEPETEFTELLQNVHNAESGWREIADTLGVGVAIVDGMQRVRSANKLFGELIGRSDGSLRGRAADELAVFMDDWGEERLSPLQRCLAGEAGPLRETLSVAGRRVTMIAARADDNRTHALLWAADDGEPERTHAAATSDFAATAFWTHSEEAAALVDVEGIVRNANPAFCRLLGQEELMLLDKPLVRLLPDAGGALLSADDVIRGETVVDTGSDDGIRMTYRLAMIDVAGVPTYLMTLQPLPEPEEEPPELNDALTGLPVRATLMGLLEKIWPKDDFAAAHALLVVDIVDFGGRNRTLGRDACDALLAAFARRLTATVANAENIARLGGDDFAVLLKLSADVEDAEAVARRIARAFAEPVRADGFELLMAVDIGLAVAPEDADSPQVLLQRAETALAVVQEAGDHVPRRYAPGMADMSTQTGDAARVLRRALARRELMLELRPVWRGVEHSVVAAAIAEVVLDTPESGRRSGPDLFTYAENLGLVAELSAWCLRAVVETYADWRNIGLTPVPLLLPIPGEAAGTPMLAQAWQAAENRYRVPPPAIIILPRGGGEKASIVGPRVAREGTADEADVLCLDTGTLKFDTAYAKRLMAVGRERGIPMILGPLKEEERAEVLQEAGIEYWYAKDDAPLTARAFGRLIARRGGEPL